ncbi:MAG: hypothetical protein JSW54_08745 [Fidelibacterota bacterium]|nr:MAG: hypothetical protein JSW54_08745 [Candidatus Neomarinimicrobiota bacterium]
MSDLYEYLASLSLGADVHLIAVSVSESGRQPQIKVTVDTPLGITIDEIANITHLLRTDEGMIQELGTSDYRLEVTSPGVESGLEEPWQFTRHVGRRLIVHLKTTDEPDGSESRVEGKLLNTSPAGIVLGLADKKDEIAWEAIQRAVVKLDW